MDKKERLDNAATITVAAVFGAFTSRFMDKTLGWPFPADLIGSVVLVFLMWAFAYHFMCVIDKKQKKTKSRLSK